MSDEETKIKGRAAICHFTNTSKKRPGVYEKELNRLTRFANSLGFYDVEIFLDKSIRKFGQTEFARFLNTAEQFDVLVVKDFRQVCLNTGKCMEIMKTLMGKGVQIFSIENGPFFLDEGCFDEPLRVATYNSCLVNPEEMKEIIPVQNEIFRMFIKKKTKWILVDQYFDETKFQNKDEQPELKKMIDNKDKYDLIVVQSLNDIHWRTAVLCKNREMLKKDIFSLKDGLWRYLSKVCRENPPL